MSDDDTIRKLASVQKIVALDPIPNADRIEVATILGWKVVVKKGEFSVGDLCIYFEVDSVLPRNPWCEFLVDENRPDKPIRLRTIKLRKQVSQGLVIPINLIAESLAAFAHEPEKFEEGEDVTELLGVTKYEPPMPAELVGIKRGNFPAFLKKTDSHRVQAHPHVIEEIHGRECYVTIKVDGTSSTFYNRCDHTQGEMDNDFGVCSRNMDLKDNDTNTYWKMAHQYNLPAVMSNSNLALQAETFGPGVQGNLLGTDALGIQVFDIFDILKYRYLNFAELKFFCEVHDLPMVEVVYIGKFYWNSVDELVEFASEQNYPNGKAAEGIVIRPMVEDVSESLEGRLAFKVISPRFLLKYDND